MVCLSSVSHRRPDALERVVSLVEPAPQVRAMVEETSLSTFAMCVHASPIGAAPRTDRPRLGEHAAGSSFQGL